MFANLKASSFYKTGTFVFKILPHKKRFRFWRITTITFVIFALWYILALVLMYAIPELFIKSKDTATDHLKDLIKEYIFHTVFFYFSLNHYYNLIAEKKPFLHYLQVSVITGISYIIYLIYRDYNFDALTQATPKITIGVIIYGYAITIVFIIGVSLLIAYLVHLRDEKKQRKILEAEKMQLEIEKSHANLNFLKAQINPHFLHNTLNFLYAKSLPYSPELSEGILTLSDIMRYALSEGNFKDGKAPLKDEIEHLRNVIRIHQLRYNNSLQVNFEVNGIVNGATIIPFVLITIAENAFKHGDLKSTEYPINIKLTVDHNSLQFYCRNKKKGGSKDPSTGIGLDNIKKRLDLAYRDQYKLDIKDEHELYTTQLIIHTL